MSFNIQGSVSLGFQPREISVLGKRSRDGEGSDLSFLLLGNIPSNRAPNQIESRVYQNYLEKNKVTDSALKSFKSCFINTDIQSMRGLIDKIRDSGTNSTTLKDRKRFLEEVGVNGDEMRAFFDVFRRCFAGNMDNLIFMIKDTASKERMELFNARVAEFDLKLLSLPSKP